MKMRASEGFLNLSIFIRLLNVFTKSYKFYDLCAKLVAVLKTMSELMAVQKPFFLLVKQLLPLL